MISSVFIRRPRLAVVVSIVILVAGFIALRALPVAQFPDIVPPQVRVSTSFPGASAADVEASVAQVLESQVNGVEGMIYMKSTSGSDGSYGLTVSFEVGTDPDLATVNVMNRVNQATSKLPSEVQRIGVTVKKQSSALLQIVAVHSPEGTRDELFLTNYGVINLIDRLARVPGVGQATAFGTLEYAMRVWFDADRMSSLDLTPQDIAAALKAQNIQAALGRVGAAPIAPGTEFQYNISTKGRLVTPEEFGDVVVRADPNGALLRVRDVARIELGAKSSDSNVRFNGKAATGIAIYQSPGANAIAVAEGVRRTMEELKASFPEDVAYEVMYDTTVFVEKTIEAVKHTLIEAFVLVAIVVFLFLGKIRATLIPIAAVPVALVGTFAAMLAFGFTANTISLLALVLAIGIVVDDAIVVVENVERVMDDEPHLTPAEATEKAMAEITGPIIAITLVLLSVFVPTAFKGEMVGTKRLHDATNDWGEIEGPTADSRWLTEFDTHSGKALLLKTSWKSFPGWSDFYEAVKPRKDKGEIWVTNGRVNETWQSGYDDLRKPYLAKRWPFPHVVINPADAAPLGIESGDFVEISNDAVYVQTGQPLGVEGSDLTFTKLKETGHIKTVKAAIQAVAIVSDEIRQGVAKAQFNMGKAMANALVPAVVDPISGNYRYKLGRGAFRKLGPSPWKTDLTAMSLKPRPIV